MLKDILSISGYGGLYKFVSQGRTGIIVESLEDSKRMNASASVKISALEDIAIFTETEDKPLKDVFKMIFDKENGGLAIGHKSSANELKDYFDKILPDYDKERVYVSDIKKVVNWYNILHKFNLLNFDEDVVEENVEEVKEVKEEKAKPKTAKNPAVTAKKPASTEKTTKKAKK